MFRYFMLCFSVCLLFGCSPSPDAEKPLVPTQEQLDKAKESGIGERQRVDPSRDGGRGTRSK